MKPVLGLGLILLLASGGLLRQPESPWESDYKEAALRARTEVKPLIAYFYTKWCGYCSQMEKTTFQDREVLQAIRNTQVWVKLNAEDEGEGTRLARKFSVHGYPTILMLRSNGDEVDRREGYLPADQLMEALRNPPKTAYADLRRAAEKQPASAQVQYALAEAHLERGEIGPALRQFQTVIELDPGNDSGLVDSSLYYRAYALASGGESDRALEEVARLKETFPDSPRLPDAIMLQGQILYYRGEPGRAREVFSGFLTDFPKHSYRTWATQLLSEVVRATSP